MKILVAGSLGQLGRALEGALAGHELVLRDLPELDLADPGAVAWMGNFVQDGIFWQFLAYCAGTGGSALIIGSAAGVAVMGLEKIDFVWALVFKMPEQKQPNPSEADPQPEVEEEEDADLDDLEAETGYDIDGDGDVGSAGTRDAAKLSGQLTISHEAWLACERIVESDLILRHAIPIDQRFLVSDGTTPRFVLSCGVTRSAPPLEPCLPRATHHDRTLVAIRKQSCCSF